MRWNYSYIQKNANPSFDFEETFSFDEDLIKKLNGVFGIENLKIIGKLKFLNSISQCSVEYQVSCILKMKCAITNENIDYELKDNDVKIFSFNSGDDDSDIIYAKGNIVDLVPYIWELIVVNVPLKVIKKGAKLTNTKGKNWKIGDFEEKNEHDEKPIDPRLESLKNYFDKH